MTWHWKNSQAEPWLNKSQYHRIFWTGRGPWWSSKPSSYLGFSLMPWKTRTTLLPLSDKNLGWTQLSVLWNTNTFSLNAQCQLDGFSKCGKAAVLPSPSPLPVLTSRSQSGGVQKLFPHIFCCALSEVTHPSPVTAHPTHSWSCKAVCLRQVLIGISGLWNHSTDRGVANSKWQPCMGVLTASAIERHL